MNKLNTSSLIHCAISSSSCTRRREFHVRGMSKYSREEKRYRNIPLLCLRLPLRCGLNRICGHPVSSSDRAGLLALRVFDILSCEAEMGVYFRHEHWHVTQTDELRTLTREFITLAYERSGTREPRGRVLPATGTRRTLQSGGARELWNCERFRNPARMRGDSTTIDER